MWNDVKECPDVAHAEGDGSRQDLQPAHGCPGDQCGACAGEIVGLLGPNGAGKTTTFRIITGEVDAEEGTIWFDGTDITRWPMYRRARLGMAYLPQEPSAFRGLTTEGNIVAVLELHRYTGRQVQERVAELLVEFGMTGRRTIKARNLSGGERRRLEVMRAMALRPAFIMLDEPFAGVDPIAVEELQNIMSGLREKSVGVLITDHNVHETLAIVDRAYVISAGEILVHGTAREIEGDALARRVFLGQQFRLRGLEQKDGTPVPDTRSGPAPERARGDDSDINTG